MNIEDFKEQFTIKDLPRFPELIFNNQKALMEKYVKIEDSNGLRWTTDIPVNIHSGKGQSQLKDFAWRIMEEIFEALETYFNMNRTELTKDELLLHTREELADGLHFLIELLILAGLKDFDIKKILNTYFETIEILNSVTGITDFERIITEDIHYRVVEFGIWLGRSMNLLKNKPWKQTQYNTDEERLYEYLKESLKRYILLMLTFMDPLDIMNLYFRKTDVNKFRIESNY